MTGPARSPRWERAARAAKERPDLFRATETAPEPDRHPDRPSPLVPGDTLQDGTRSHGEGPPDVVEKS
jgi:hypothetical protein